MQYFNNIDCDFELTFSDSAEIVPVRDGTAEGEMKKISVNPIKISCIIPHIPSVVDVCDIVPNLGAIETFIYRAGKEITKLELSLAEKSIVTIKCTSVGEKCSQAKETIERIDRFDKITFNADYPESVFTVRLNNVKTKRYDAVDVEIVHWLLQEISKMDEEKKDTFGCPAVTA